MFSKSVGNVKGWSAAAKWMWNILGVVPKRLQVRFPLPSHSYLLLRKTHKFCLGHISTAEYKLQETIFAVAEKCYTSSVIVETSTINLGIVFVSNGMRNMRNEVSGGITLKMQKYCKHVHSPGQPALGGCAWARSRWPPQVPSNCSPSVTLWQSNYKEGGPYTCHVHWHQSWGFLDRSDDLASDNCWMNSTLCSKCHTLSTLEIICLLVMSFWDSCVFLPKSVQNNIPWRITTYCHVTWS